MFTCCSLTEGGTRLSACGTRRQLLRSPSPPAPLEEGDSFPGRSACPSLRQAAVHTRPISAGLEAVVRQDR